MKSSVNQIVLFLFVLALCIAGFHGVNAHGECGRASPEREAYKLVPCAMAGHDVNAPVSDACCAKIKQLGQNPSCLCAVMLSNTAKSSGVKPEVAVTIPKRCNLADRPVGYKCGGEFQHYIHTYIHIYIIVLPSLIVHTDLLMSDLSFIWYCSLHIALKSEEPISSHHM